MYIIMLEIRDDSNRPLNIMQSGSTVMDLNIALQLITTLLISSLNIKSNYLVTVFLILVFIRLHDSCNKPS